MQKVLEGLFNQYNSGHGNYKEEIHRINCHKGMLKKDFSKRQNKIFLKIEDDKDLIAEKRAIDSFAEGVRYGVIFMTEVFTGSED